MNEIVNITMCLFPTVGWWLGKKRKQISLKFPSLFFLLQIIFSAASLDSLAPEVHPRPVVGTALHPRLGADVQVALLHRGAGGPGDPWDWWLAGVGSSYRLVIRGKSWPHGTEPGGGIVICNGWLPLLGGQGRLGPLFNISCNTCWFSPTSNFSCGQKIARRKSNPRVALQKSVKVTRRRHCKKVRHIVKVRDAKSASPHRFVPGRSCWVLQQRFYEQ